MKIPPYKYKFKQIFMTIGPVKALGCSPKLFIPDNVYFAAVLTLTMKVKKKPHLCRTIELSDHRAV